MDPEKLRRIEENLTDRFIEGMPGKQKRSTLEEAFEKALEDPLGLEPEKEKPLIDLQKEIEKDLGSIDSYDEWI